MKLARWPGLVGLVAVILALPALGDEEKRRQPKAVTFGEVTKVEAGTGQLTVKTSEGKLQTFRVDKATRLRFRGDDVPERLSSFKAGTKVRVRYVAEKGNNRALVVVANPLFGEEVRREVQEAFRAVKEYTFQQKDEYRAKAEKLITELDQQIEDLEARAEKAKGEIKEQINREIQDLQKKRAAVEKRMSRLKVAGAEAWEEVKLGLQNAVDELRKGLEEAEREIDAADPAGKIKKVPPEKP